MQLTPDQQRRKWSISLIRQLWEENRRLKKELMLKQRLLKQNGSNGQTKLGSMVEAATNMLVGFGVSVAANLLVLPAFGYSPGLQEATEIGMIFTGISLARSYVLRRVFNRRINASID